MCSWRSFDRHLIGLLGLLGLLGLMLAGCQAENPPDNPSEDTDTGAVHFRTTLDGQAVHLVLADCEAFLVQPDGSRTRVLSTDFYPMFSVCQRQEASVSEGYILVQLGRQALGAGGCCATEGTWRSRDGKTWERRQAGDWVRLEKSATPTAPPDDAAAQRVAIMSGESPGPAIARPALSCRPSI
jgi:hypothetical protein